MKFLSFVQQGIEKSNKSLAAIAEVDAAFGMVNEELRSYQDGELKLDRAISTIARIASFSNDISGVESDHFKHDRLILSLKNEYGTFTGDVAGWKQRKTGYPCVLIFDGQELSCGNLNQLLTGISELLSSIGFGNAVNRLVTTAKASGKDKQPASQEVKAKPLAKPAAKPVAKAAARAIRPTAKAVATKAPAAKAPSIEPVAKKPSKKPQRDEGDFSR